VISYISDVIQGEEEEEMAEEMVQDREEMVQEREERVQESSRGGIDGGASDGCASDGCVDASDGCVDASDGCVDRVSVGAHVRIVRGYQGKVLEPKRRRTVRVSLCVYMYTYVYSSICIHI